MCWWSVLSCDGHTLCAEADMIVRATHGDCGLGDTCAIVNAEGYLIWSYTAGRQSSGTHGREHVFQVFPSVRTAVSVPGVSWLGSWLGS